MLDTARLWLAGKLVPTAVRSQADSFAAAILSGSSVGGLSGSVKSTQGLLDAYNRMPWLRAVVHKVSHSVASTSWKLLVVRGGNQRAVRFRDIQRGNYEYRRKALNTLVKQQQVEVTEILDHPLLDVLHDGSEMFPGVSVLQLTQAYMDLVGEAIQLKERGTNILGGKNGQGMPSSLVPIPPHWVRQLPKPNDPFFEIQLSRSGDVRRVPASDVIYYRDPNPLDPFGRGSGTAFSIGDELQANEAASLTIRSRLENNAIPPFIAMPDVEGIEGPTSEQLDRIREDWQRRLRGPSKAGFIHFLKQKFQFEKLGNTFEELSLIPLLRSQRDTILQVYGAPPELFGIVENSNRATIESAEFLYAKHVLVPRIEATRSVLQVSLVPEFDDRLILDYESPVPDDKEFHLSVMKEASWAFQADEVREEAGSEALPDDQGKIFAVPANLFLQRELVPTDTPPSPAPGPGDNPPPGDTPAGPGGGPGEPSPAPSDKPPPGDTPPPPGDNPQQQTFRELMLMVKDGVAEAERMRRILLAVDPEDLGKASGVEFREGVRSSGQRRLDELGFGVAFDMNDPRVIQFLAEQSARQVVRINNTTRRLLQQALTDGFNAGEDIGALTRRIRDIMGDGRRALRIARTESVRALNGGQVIATKQAGFQGKQWLSTRDDKVRDTHAPGSGMDGQIRPVDANFESPSGAVGPWPGAMSTAAESVNCRCTTISVAKVPDQITEIVWPPNLATEKARQQVWKADEQHRLPIERRLYRAFRRGFAIQEDKAIRTLRESA